MNTHDIRGASPVYSCLYGKTDILHETIKKNVNLQQKQDYGKR